MCLLDLLASFRAERPDWSLKVLLCDDGPLCQAVADLDVPVAVLPLPAELAAIGDAGLSLGLRSAAGALRVPWLTVKTLGYLTRLRRQIRRESPDLVQTNGMKAHLLAAWAAPRAVPLVWHLHDYLGSRVLMSRLLNGSARRNVHGVAVSRSVADDASRVLGGRIPIEPIYNAADLDRFAPGPDEGPWLDAQAGFPTATAGTVRVGLVATYARWKGHDVFLDAVARLSTDLPARFFIVGGPLYRSAGSQFATDELRTRIKALGLEGRVGLAGHQPDPARVFRSLDVVVHASTRPEPFGRVIVEAMACGRAVVASRTGGATELFDDGISALGCESGDPAALASALTRLILDGELRRALGAGGRAAAAARFDRRRLAGEWARVYAGVGLRV